MGTQDFLQKMLAKKIGHGPVHDDGYHFKDTHVHLAMKVGTLRGIGFGIIGTSTLFTILFWSSETVSLGSIAIGTICIVAAYFLWKTEWEK